jgi:hypothetical protein
MTHTLPLSKRPRVFRQGLRTLSSIKTVISEANGFEALNTNTHIYLPWSLMTLRINDVTWIVYVKTDSLLVYNLNAVFHDR